MNRADAFLLPISSDDVDTVLRCKTNDALMELTVPQIAAIRVVSALGSHAQKQRLSTSWVEQQLAAVIHAGLELESARPGSFASHIAKTFDLAAFEAGLYQLQSLGIELMEPFDVDDQAYLHADGSWDYSFSTRYAESKNRHAETFVQPNGKVISLSAPQARALTGIKREVDESLFCQALAGTGKTFLVLQMIEQLRQYSPLVLAYTKAQLTALLHRAGAHGVRGMTFGELADHVLSGHGHLRNVLNGPHTHPRYRVDLGGIGKLLGFRSVGTLDIKEVAALCNRMVISYCASSDSQITEALVPPSAVALGPAEKSVIAAYARSMWNEIISPSHSDFRLPLRGYHRIKLMSLMSDGRLPHDYSHILVDEAHDMPVPLSQFLEGSGVPLIEFGDACQSVKPSFFTRETRGHRREITQSIRAGRQIEAVINPLIERHPLVRVQPIVGSINRQTLTIFYDKPQIPEKPAAILVKSEWGLFEWLQRLSTKSVPFRILPASAGQFQWFVSDCISLFTGEAVPKHGALFKYRTWDQVRRAVEPNDCSFSRIERMLESGYRYRDFEAALAGVSDDSESAYIVGIANDAKNMEFDRVMLTPDLFPMTTSSNRSVVTERFVPLYIGSTRAKFELHVPGYLKDWVLDQTNKLS